MRTQENPAHHCTVSELTRDVKVLLESHFDWVSVEGEIGDFTAASSGHWYFTLKDARSQVRCAMFRRSNARVKVKPQRGDHVQIRARVSLYEARGEFQLICEHLAPAGDGALQLAFEQLKQRLSDEGLFDQERKQDVPADATRIGVVTSATGAAIHDILSVLARRSPRAEVLLYPVPVQGEPAPEAIAAAITQANTLHKTGKQPLEVLIVGRGGGSLEDLWAFNDERVARSIAASELPIVSAVGHEVDFSIADFVADTRAPTPSAAAELVTLDQSEWQQRFDDRQAQLRQSIQRRLFSHQQRLHHLSRRLRHPGQLLAQQRQAFGQLERRLLRVLPGRLGETRSRMAILQSRLARQHPAQRVERQRRELSQLQNRLQVQTTAALSRSKRQLEQQARLLESLGPGNTLARGYAIVTGPSGQALRQSMDTEIGEQLNVQLASGSLVVEVTNQKD